MKMRRYFLQQFTEKERWSKEFCLRCGILTEIKDMDVLREIHGDCWQWYRLNGIPYKPPAYYP